MSRNPPVLWGAFLPTLRSLNPVYRKEDAGAVGQSPQRELDTVESTVLYYSQLGAVRLQGEPVAHS